MECSVAVKNIIALLHHILRLVFSYKHMKCICIGLPYTHKLKLYCFSKIKVSTALLIFDA